MVTEDELQTRVEQRLAAAGVAVKLVNSPSVRGHVCRWCVVLDRPADTRPAVTALRNTDGVCDVKGSKSAALVTFEAIS